MAKFEQTQLPGVGVRHDFQTESGRRVGVITRHSGRRELLVYDQRDPDACRASLELSNADRIALVELLGGGQVTASLMDSQQRVEGLAIDWFHLHANWAAAGQTIGDTQLRRRTGVSIVAVLRGGETVPSPQPSEPLNADDTVVVVGTPHGIETALSVLRDG